jgi:F420-non-reducing hydrogenase iron-sulfur subunit
MGECHYLDGNVHMSKHMKVVEYLLDLTGIGRDRMAVRWLSAAEGRLFAEYVNEFSEKTRQLGPFDPREFELSLAAARDALNAPRLRWLMGMELQIIEKGNVYKEKIEEKEYWNLLKKAAEDEYHGALILEVLKKGALSVREIALNTGLPVYTVSLRLGELERCRKAKLKGYDGNISLFSSLVTEAA